MFIVYVINVQFGKFYKKKIIKLSVMNEEAKKYVHFTQSLHVYNH